MSVICSECRRDIGRLCKFCVLANGLAVLLIGVVLVFVDRFVLSTKAEPTVGPPKVEALWTTIDADRHYVYDPPDWVAYAAISLGAVVTLYVVALPKKGHEPPPEHAH